MPCRCFVIVGDLEKKDPTVDFVLEPSMFSPFSERVVDSFDLVSEWVVV